MHESTFYDAHPFDWTRNYERAEVQDTLALPLTRFIDELPADSLVADVGCGAGRVMSCLAARDIRSIGIDLSHNSVRIMMESTKQTGIVASNLNLPLPDEIVDRVISDGVVHHTENPFRSFSELSRILKPGGLLYLAVYKPGGHYQRLYRFPGAMIRRLLGSSPGRVLVFSTFLPIYYSVRFLKSRGKTSWRGATNLFYDYFVTPIVVFLSRETIERWRVEAGLELLDYDPNPILNVQSFVFRKPIPNR